MRPLSAALPALTIVLLAALAALPWGLPAENRFVQPLIPFAAIHYWSLREPARVPSGLVFGAGLAFDVVSDAPLGYWALVYLLGYALTLAARPLDAAGPLGRWGVFALLLAALALIEAFLSSIYFGERADWRPLALAVGWVALLYPLLAVPLRLLRGRTFDGGDDRGQRLARGG